MKETAEGIKSIPSQIADFAADPLKGGFAADLASIPLTVASGGLAGKAAPAVARATVAGARTAVGALEGAAVRAQVALSNSKNLSIVSGFTTGAAGLPKPAAQSPAFNGAYDVGKAAHDLISAARKVGWIP